MQITKAAGQILDTLTAGLSAGDIRRVGEQGGAFMQVVVECQGDGHYSVSHYYESNGDLVPDPDMTFYRRPSGAWIPLSVTQQGRYYQRVAEVDDGVVSTLNAEGLKTLCRFSAMWMRNIEQQQDLTALAAPIQG